VSTLQIACSNVVCTHWTCLREPSIACAQRIMTLNSDAHKLALKGTSHPVATASALIYARAQGTLYESVLAALLQRGVA
jgi:bifunctional ADP-heptose synthase (sugar kinase/adenylyltransferase)